MVFFVATKSSVVSVGKTGFYYMTVGSFTVNFVIRVLFYHCYITSALDTCLRSTLEFLKISKRVWSLIMRCIHNEETTPSTGFHVKSSCFFFVFGFRRNKSHPLFPNVNVLQCTQTLLITDFLEVCFILTNFRYNFLVLRKKS